jgi:hypothetical protein
MRIGGALPLHLVAGKPMDSHGILQASLGYNAWQGMPKRLNKLTSH